MASNIPVEGVNREENFSLRVTSELYEAVKNHAKRRNMNMADHIRDVMGRAAKGEIKVGGETAQLPLL